MPSMAEASSIGVKRVALGKRLRKCADVPCLGVNPNWEKYPPCARDMIREAQVVFYPGPLYESVLLSLGKEIFPRNSCDFIGNKIKQTDLFQLLGIPHPRTRIYYGRNRAERIGADFDFPFIAKTPVGSSMGKGVWLIRNARRLEGYLAAHRPAYIQEYLPIDRDLRVVLAKGCVVHAYWRIGAHGNFRNNVSQGARISFESIPDDGLAFAADVARVCRFDEVGLDICRAETGYRVIEANMVYGLEGFALAGIDIYDALADLFKCGER